MRRFYHPITFFFLFSLILFVSVKVLTSRSKNISNKPIVTVTEPSPTPAPPTPTPTPKPLTFAEMNKLYGPCIYLPTLMYHRIRPLEESVADKSQYLTVAPDTFRSQLQYLKNKGYRFATMQELINFFNSGTPIPSKSVLLTFDDGYADFNNASPILSEQQASATLFLSTGLAENPGYITWNQVTSLPSSILVANHTWSHKNMQSAKATVESEITTADTQLNQHGLNNPKVFAYPYGVYSQTAETVLTSLGYQLAFTTQPGSTLCKQKRFSLPRIRVGNSSLSSYGL